MARKHAGDWRNPEQVREFAATVAAGVASRPGVPT
jgi:hypothetical protein